MFKHILHILSQTKKNNNKHAMQLMERLTSLSNVETETAARRR